MRRAAWVVTSQSTANQTSAGMRHSLDLDHHMILSQEVIAQDDMTSAHHCLQDSDKLSAGVIYPDNCQQGKRLLQLQHSCRNVGLQKVSVILGCM